MIPAICMMTLQPVLMILSQEEGVVKYSTYSANLMSEVSKATVSSVLLCATVDFKTIQPTWLGVLSYSVPGLIYFMNNNLVFRILMSLDATTFQLVGQLKIVFTGLLFRLVLKRKLSEFQYLAIWQLACGTAVSQIPQGGLDRPSSSSAEGFALCVVSCLLSALGGIYTEKLMKGKAEDSIHWQNLQLYSWGIGFNLIGSIAHAPDMFTRNTLFDGYNAWAVAGITNNTIMGLTISAILKYADNIARVYAHAIAMLITMVLSVLLFGTKPTMQLVLGIMVVTASAIQYHLRSGEPEYLEAKALDAQKHHLLMAPEEGAVLVPMGAGAKVALAEACCDEGHEGIAGSGGALNNRGKSVVVPLTRFGPL